MLNARWTATPQAAALSGCSMRSQTLCLAAYLDPDTATRAAYLTAALSHACHYHPYELAPMAAELTGWLDDRAAGETPFRNKRRSANAGDAEGDA